MTIPNYLVIGAPKCGTTSMCDLLGSHPDVFHIGVDPDVPLADPGRRRDGFLAGILRRAPGFASVKRVLPSSLIRRGKRLLTEEQDLTVRWDPEIKAATLREFQEDSEAFLRFFGKPADFWLSQS